MNLQGFLRKAIGHSPSVGEEKYLFVSDQFPLEDEAIADIAINAMLLIMNMSSRPMGLRSDRDVSIDDYLGIAVNGIRFPWKDRLAFASCVDLENDELPDCAAIGLTRTQYKQSGYAQALYAIRPRKKPVPSFSALSGCVATYRVGWVRGFACLSRSSVRRGSKEFESLVNPGFAGVLPDGTCVGSSIYGEISPLAARLLAYVVGMENDKRYHWDVFAHEPFLGFLPAKAHFSVDAEYVKSLFYARSIPLTDTGRLRPILHWVRAHQRRMREGIEIDISRHLRGISAFEMHGLNFEIESPRKRGIAKAN